jgi:hypothetical protein
MDMNKRIMAALGAAALATAAGGAAYRWLLRPWHLRWGASADEIARTLPGDEIVPNATLIGNRAVTIDARPEEVWPWLVQIGKGRAGFYSYDWIENLMGLGITSADRILPEFQRLRPGDVLPGLGPVRAVEPNRYLLLGGSEPWGAVSWVLALEPIAGGRTRLISRTRYALRWGTLLRTLPARYVPFYLLFEPGEFVMLRKMLLGIGRRAERAARTARAVPSPAPV